MSGDSAGGAASLAALAALKAEMSRTGTSSPALATRLRRSSETGLPTVSDNPSSVSGGRLSRSGSTDADGIASHGHGTGLSPASSASSGIVAVDGSVLVAGALAARRFSGGAPPPPPRH